MPTTEFQTTSSPASNGGTAIVDSTISYIHAHDKTSQFFNSSIGYVQNEVDGITWLLGRFPMGWDTSSLGAGAQIGSAYVSLKIGSNIDLDGGTDTLVLVNGDGLVYSALDFGTLLSKTASRGYISTGDLPAAGSDEWFNINLNATGLTEINKTGITRFGLRFGKDISVTNPVGDNLVTFFANRGGDLASCAKLFVTYTNLSVTTDPATLISSTGATLNGTLTSAGAETGFVSFEWGLTTSYGTDTLEAGMTGSGSFSKAIGNNLVEGTTYHFRARARPSGTSTYVYGSDRTFVTAGGSDTLIRVHGIVHRFAAGPNEGYVYEMEQTLGGLSSQFIPPLNAKKSKPTIETEQQNTGKQMTLREALYQYFVWGNHHTRDEVRAIFGKFPVDFNTWWAWYKEFGTGAF